MAAPEMQRTMLTFFEILGKPHYERDRSVGKDEGLAESLAEGKLEIVRRLLSRRFGPLPEAVTTRVAAAGTEDLERWSDRLLDAASLDDVFAG
jgi:hypothetical protein